MKIHVTKADIEKGRSNVTKICGCPIWHAINRQLKLGLSVDSKLLSVPSMSRAKLGNVNILLPENAIVMQAILTEAPQAEVKPFSFVADFKYDAKQKAAKSGSWFGK